MRLVAFFVSSFLFLYFERDRLEEAAIYLLLLYNIIIKLVYSRLNK